MESALLKVLIVDDSPLIASRLRQQINALRQVQISGVAVNISSALEQVKISCPDVAILDIYLRDDAPDRNGITLLNLLRQGYPDMQIIMLTNISGPQYYNRCMELGARSFLDKSSEFEKVSELLLDIHQALNNLKQ